MTDMLLVNEQLNPRELIILSRFTNILGGLKDFICVLILIVMPDDARNKRELDD